MKLPLLYGWAFLKHRQSDPHLSSIPVVVFTALALPEERERALDMGDLDYLIKPLSTGELESYVQKDFHQL